MNRSIKVMNSGQPFIFDHQHFDLSLGERGVFGIGQRVKCRLGFYFIAKPGLGVPGNLLSAGREY